MSRSGIRYLCSVVLFVFPFPGFNQNIPSTTCQNSNFITGTFQNWNGCWGNFNYPCLTAGFDSTSTYPVHRIISNITALDPNTLNNLFEVLPGETHSARLGHDNGNLSGAQLRYTIVVNALPYNFKYFYAIVLDNPAHVPQQQPSFTIDIRDASGNIVDPVHGYHYYGAQSGLPGWQTCTVSGQSITWLNWTSDSVDLSSFFGQTITATFTSKDCALGGHHGYAYINTYCISPVNREWTGAVNNQWNNPLNWNPAGVPTSIDLVTIPSTAAVMPQISNSGMSINELHIGDGATITILPGIHLTVNGNIVIDAP
ncbi:MAG: hypothetical protein NTX61_03855 [Bacteroidetes bacterium]|nr:hypothetical protein [Bacteroidota bacterium]